MKQLLMGAIVLFLFSASVVLIQTSCSKTTAQSTNSINQLNKIVYFKNMNSSVLEVWSANYDGTGASQIPITLPSGVSYDTFVMTNSLSISPDGQTIFFTCLNSNGSSPVSEIYTCSIAGGNAIMVATGFAGKVQAY